MFAAAVVIVALLLGRAVNGLTDVAGDVPDFAVHGDGDISWKDAALVLLAVLFLVSLVRQGPRAFVGELFEADGDAESGHDHSHGHDHDTEDECCDHDCSDCNDEANMSPAHGQS